MSLRAGLLPSRSTVSVPDTHNIHADTKCYPRWSALLACVLLAISACTNKSHSPAPPQVLDPLPPGDPSRPLAPTTQIFLIAGGPDVANFAEEVAAQRRHFHRLGFSDAQIACYWARPTPEAYLDDLEQYRRLAPEVADCYPAKAGLLSQHLRQVANARPSWIYIYITSHGRETMLPARARGLTDPEATLLDQHFIQMGSDPGYGANPVAVVEGYRRGLQPSQLLLTPTTLRSDLTAFPASTTKYVMLQACHGGGFLTVDDPNDRVPRIANLPNLVAIAAARHDRPSFGCEPGSTMTYFGEIFFDLLSNDFSTTPQAIDWEIFFGQLNTAVTKLERQQGVPPSHPVLSISG